MLLVFIPDPPSLFSLNPSAQLILEFCDGRTGTALERAYAAATKQFMPHKDAIQELHMAVRGLEEKGVIQVQERVPTNWLVDN